MERIFTVLKFGNWVEKKSGICFDRSSFFYQFSKYLVLPVLIGIGSICQSGFAQETQNWTELKVLNLYKFFPPDQFEPFMSAEERHLFSETKGLVEDSFSFKIIKHDQIYYLFKKCHLNYWIWNGQEWAAQINSDSVGEYCDTKPVIDNGMVSFVGGSGFWENKSDLIYLNTSTQYPEFIPIDNQPENYFGRIRWRIDPGVLFLIGEATNPRLAKENLSADRGFFLDIQSKKWSRSQIQWKEDRVKDLFSKISDEHSSSFDLQHFGLFFGEILDTRESFLFVLDKRTLDFYYKSFPYFPYSDINWYMIFEGDSLLLSVGESKGTQWVHPEEFVQIMKPVGKADIFPSGQDSINYLALVGGLVLVLVLFYLFGTSHTNFSKVKSEADMLSLDPQFQAFLAFQEERISQHQLDTILNIQDISNPDLRKVQRARKINELNSRFQQKMGVPLITRERDELDRRMMQYCISSFQVQTQSSLPQSSSFERESS